MATTDTITITLKMPKEMQNQRRVGQERLKTSEERMQARLRADMKDFEGLFAAKIRRHRDIIEIRPVLRCGQAPAAATASTDRFPLAKGDYD